MKTAVVQEIFSGIQGEGSLVGLRQVFVRFSGCNLACRYCDTPSSRSFTASALLEKSPGGREFINLRNPLSVAVVQEAVGRLSLPPLRWVGFTGGEPLLQAEFFLELLPLLKGAGHRIYVETNGTLPEAMELLSMYADFIAMDLKIPSAAGTRVRLGLHEAFLRAAKAADLPERICLKAVVSEETKEEELVRYGRMAASINPGICFVLQPVTAVSPEVRPPAELDVLKWQRRLLEILEDVRVIPQVHKLMGQK